MVSDNQTTLTFQLHANNTGEKLEYTRYCYLLQAMLGEFLEQAKRDGTLAAAVRGGTPRAPASSVPPPTTYPGDGPGGDPFPSLQPPADLPRGDTWGGPSPSWPPPAAM